MTADRAPSLDGAPDHPRTRRPRRRFALLVVAALAIAFATLTLLDAMAVARELRAGRARFSQLTDRGLTGGGTLSVEADAGARTFAKAARRANDSAWLGALGKVPFFGRPARWLRAASSTAAELGREAATSVRRLEPRLDRNGDPAARLELLGLMESELSRLSDLVRAVRIPSTGGFLPPVNAADHELRADLARLRKTLGDGLAAARGVRSMLTGPSSYVVLAANNSEMRAGGMVLQVGLLTASGGRIDAGGFRSTAELVLPKAVPIPAELDSLYGWLEPGKEWRNVGTSPNFPAVAPIYAAMAQRSGLSRVDGVMQIDVLGVRALLEVIGPIDVDGRRYDASNVERLMMHDLYVRFGFEQFERRHEFSRLAAEAFRVLTERKMDIAELVRTVGAAADGRHLMVWSSRADEQRAWERLGVAGALDRDGLMVTIQNHGGNKLDWFVRGSMTLAVEHPSGRFRQVRLRIRIFNPTPARQPDYVVGDGRIVPKGVYRAFVSVYLPGWASNVELVGRDALVIGTDGPMRVVATRLDIARGAFEDVEMVFSVPPDEDRIILLPSARATPLEVGIASGRIDDAIERSIPV